MRTLKKVYLSPPAEMFPLFSATRNTLQSNIEFASELGFRTVIAERSLLRFYHAHLLEAWLSADIFLTTYPGWTLLPDMRPNALASRVLDRAIISALRCSKPSIGSVLYVWDLPLHQSLPYRRSRVHAMNYEFEKAVFDTFDVLIVFNANMRNAIASRYRISEEKFIESEILDYQIDFRPPIEKPIETDKWRIAYAGNLDRKIVGEWMIRDLPRLNNLSYEFMGPSGGWIAEIGRRDVKYGGFKNTYEELANHLSQTAHFGIISYSNRMRRYVEFGPTSKLGAYVTAGLPILVPSYYRNIAHLVRKYGIGLAFDSFNQLPKTIEGLSQSEYDVMRKRCRLLAEQMKEGHFFKRAVKTALNKLGIT